MVCQWDGNDTADLQKELVRIQRELQGDRVEHRGAPHKNPFPKDLEDFTACITGGVDKNAMGRARN